MKVDLLNKFQAVEDYLNNKNLKVVAHKYGVHYSTLSRWLKRFYNLPRNIHLRQWNRLPTDIEEKIMILKENKPDITLHQAKNLLKQKRIKVSIKGIYNVWNRYGMIKRLMDDPFSYFCEPNKESKDYLEYVRYLLSKDKSPITLKKAAKLINLLPCYPAGYGDVLENIPERFLSLRRRFDKLYDQFLKIPTPQFYQKIHRLRLQMEKKGLYYSSIIAGLSEILALHWMRTPDKELALNELLTERKGRLKNSVLNFLLTFLAATAKLEMLDIEGAKRFITKAERLLKALPYASFYESFGDVMTFMSDYNSALTYYSKALDSTKDNEAQARLCFKIGLNLTIAGKHKETLKYLKKFRIRPGGKYYESYTLTQTLVNFGLGRLEESDGFIQKTLEKSEREQFRNTIYTAICCLAAIKRALGNIKESNQLLENYLPLMKKYGMQRERLIMEFLLEKKLEKILEVPTVYVFHLIQQAKDSLKAGDYKKIFSFAEKYGITGYVQRCLFFVPELVLHHLSKGRDVMLPKPLLKLPIFNKNFPFYELRFLGPIIIYKNHTYLKIQPSPQLSAFIINLALHLREPGSRMNLENIVQNCWRKSRNPMGRLYHLLVQSRVNLKLPSHFLDIEKFGYEKYLVNKGFYIWTDYNYFEIQLAQAKALDHAGEWAFARREYLRAFKLFRGEPFKKNFDEWSVNMRFKILTQLETEAINFVKTCLEHHNKQDARKLLEKILNIIPDSEEIKKQLDDL